MNGGTLHQRIRYVLGDLSIRELSRRIGLNAETVRRYVNGQHPPVEFIARLCELQNVSAHWLLTGEGEASPDARRVQALETVAPEVLVNRVRAADIPHNGVLDRFETEGKA